MKEEKKGLLIYQICEKSFQLLRKQGQPILGSIYLKDLTSSYVILQEKNTHVEVTLNISGG